VTSCALITSNQCSFVQAAPSEMWLEVLVVLTLSNLCALQKEDYEYEELQLKCSFEQLNGM
jgi:hypothetical protein